MRIVVLIKQVPEVSELRFDPASKRLQRDGVPSLINPFDRRAVLEALRLREERGGSVAVVTMGPPQASSALEECASLGVDRVVHLSDRGFAGADTLATSRALARAVDRLGADLVLAGRYSIDAETGQVGPEVAELLGVPFLGGVRRLVVEERSAGGVGAGAQAGDPTAAGAGSGIASALEVRAECEGDDGFAEVACALPAVATCTDRWKTRTPVVVPDEEVAARVARDTWSVADLGGAPGDYGQDGSPTWVADLQTIELSRARERIDARDGDAGLRRALDAVATAIDRARAETIRNAGVPQRHVRRPDPRGSIWVVAERGADGRLRPISFELLGAADGLAADLGCGVASWVIDSAPTLGDDPQPAAAGERCARDAAALGRCGADLLFAPQTGGAWSEGEVVGALVDAIGAHRPRAVLLPATALGRDVAPAVAARLGLGLTGDAIGVELDAEGRLRQLKPAFGGQIVAPILSRTRPEMATIRPGILERPREEPDRAAAEIVRLPRSASGPGGRIRRLAFTREVSEEGASLEAAEAVVCLGFGLGSAERVPAARRLAAALGGAVGATRRVCDLGWVPRQLQIGISGRSVSPALYLALGVRGSFNHLVGMQRAGVVVAVNKNPDAEIFAAADLCIVGDAPSFLEAALARFAPASP
jgi:electron transfer flavoprotein alpha subunit